MNHHRFLRRFLFIKKRQEKAFFLDHRSFMLPIMVDKSIMSDRKQPCFHVLAPVIFNIKIGTEKSFLNQIFSQMMVMTKGKEIAVNVMKIFFVNAVKIFFHTLL